MAYRVQYNRFLCFFPVRLGVFVLSSMHFLLAAVVAAIIWYGLASKNVHLDTGEKISFIVVGVSNTVFAIVALLGLCGTIFRRLPLVELYSTLLNWYLVVFVVAGIFNLIMMFTTNEQTLIDGCIDGSTDQDTTNTCRQHVIASRFLFVAFYCVQFSVHLYECIIIASYASQLREMQGKIHLRSLNTKTYGEVPGRESTEALHRPDPIAGSAYLEKNTVYDAGEV